MGSSARCALLPQPPFGSALRNGDEKAWERKKLRKHEAGSLPPAQVVSSVLYGSGLKLKATVCQFQLAGHTRPRDR